MGVSTDVAGAFMETVGEVTAASVVEVIVKELKQISTGLVRMSAMLTRKMTPDRATMLHSEFPISPTWRANC
jgi:ubiquinone biosynthesis protein UbiJ